MKALLFGIGGIGGGVVLPLTAEAGIECTIVARSPERRKELQNNPILTVSIADEGRHEMQAFPLNHIIDETDSSAIRDCMTNPEYACLFTAVGGNNLSVVAQVIAPSLAERYRKGVPPIRIFPFENVALSGNRMTSLIASEVHRADYGTMPCSTVVDCMAFRNPSNGGIVRETYEDICICNGNFLEETHPLYKVADIRWVNSVSDYYYRKIALVSAIHTAIAWLGLDNGINQVNDAANEASIFMFMNDVVDEMAAAVHYTTNGMFLLDDLIRYGCLTLERVSNPHLGDNCHKFVRNMPDKIAPEGRFGKPAIHYLEKTGETPKSICRVIALGLTLAEKYTDSVNECRNAVSRYPQELQYEILGFAKTAPVC